MADVLQIILNTLFQDLILCDFFLILCDFLVSVKDDSPKGKNELYF